jgi:hypothetical protein
VEKEREPSRLRRLIAALPYLIPVGILLTVAIVIVLIAIGAYSREWEWTGFLGKTLWDWMHLLLVPIILALGGLFFTQMERRDSARAQKLTQEQIRQTQVRLERDAEQALRDSALERYGQSTQRFMQAVDQLGADKLEIRLGGIYSLERTAQEDRDYHWPIMELLSTFVRETAPRRPPISSEEWVEEIYPPRPDIQAVLSVIGRRAVYHRTDSSVEYGIIDLRDTDIRRADLQHAYLQGANFQGADLQEANLQGATLQEANLRGATLQRANLQGANLQGARRITEDQIEWTLGSNETKLPEDLNRPELWSKSIEEQVKIIREHMSRD